MPYRVEAAAVGGKLNRDEAVTIASMLAAACEQPEYADASFGVISMVGEETAFEIDVLLRGRLDPAEYQRRRVRVGNPSQFQGDERDVMFLSLVGGPADGPLRFMGDDSWRKRFNVAASRARDQLWVVHSMDPQIDLQPGDLRRRLIEHAKDPRSISRQIDIAVAQSESPFEAEVIRRLIESGYRIRPQFPVGHYRIDIVVEGAGSRLAVECDGDRYHPIEMLGEDLARQEILERLGWRFVRIRGSAFYSNPEKAMEPVFEKLRVLGIEPMGSEAPSEQPDVDGDLVRRVIRRAAEIRSEWEVEAASPSGAPSRRRRGRLGTGDWRLRRLRLRKSIARVREFSPCSLGRSLPGTCRGPSNDRDQRGPMAGCNRGAETVWPHSSSRRQARCEVAARRWTDRGGGGWDERVGGESDRDSRAR